MTIARRMLGKNGENIAVQYLQRRGYQIVDRNVRLRIGEIDVIAKDGETLVFVEVRTRRSAAYGSALESVGPQKQMQLLRTVRHYIGLKGLHDVASRIDVIGISWSPSDEKPIIEHVRNAIVS